MSGRLGFAGHLKTLFVEPALLWEAFRAALAMRRIGRPTPSTAYLDWRMYTAYGSHNDTASSDDLVHYLRWRRQMRRLASWERAA